MGGLPGSVIIAQAKAAIKPGRVNHAPLAMRVRPAYALPK
jgi:hypothetical protein